MIPDYLSAMANHVWQSTLFAAAAALLVLSLRRNGAAARYWLWAAASLKFLAPFALLLNAGKALQSHTASPLSRHEVVSAVQGMSAPIDAGVWMSFSNSSPAAQTSRLAAVLFSIWILGGAVVLVMWVREWHRLRRVIRSASPVSLNSPIPALSTTARVEPGVLGIFRPILLLPEGVRERLTNKQFEAILAHELCHVRRRDNLTALLHMIVETLFWFHPLVWWIERRMIQERERACDEEVLRQTADAETYAKGILNVCRHYVGASVICMSGVSGSNLRKRIEDIMVRPIALHLNFARKFVLAAAALAAVVLPISLGMLSAQTAPVPARFEVASIKKNTEGKGVSFGPMPGGRLIAVNNPAMNFIVNAFDVRPYQIVGAPDWTRTDRYDMEAKTEGNATSAQMMPMLRALLEDRFKLKVHRETREMPVFILTLTKNGLKVPLSTAACRTFNPNVPPPPPNADGTPIRWCNNLLTGTPDGNMRWRAQNVGMAGVSGALSSALGRAVIDKTGFTGTIDVDVVFSRDGVSGDDSPPVLSTVLQDQLGLKIESGKGPVEVLVIDHVERPSEN
jgi:bla regulator protein blaR1